MNYTLKQLQERVNLTMLTQREQLMEDIECIINNYFEYFDVKHYDEELVKVLCDAVCRNFPYLEMLTAREQLMEDIDSIITEYFQGVDDAELNQVTEILCDAVCRNFPTN